MDANLHPIVNGCYINRNTDMFKVRMLAYSGKNINKVILEDTCGKIISTSLNGWNDLRLMPCCIANPAPKNILPALID